MKKKEKQRTEDDEDVITSSSYGGKKIVYQIVGISSDDEEEEEEKKEKKKQKKKTKSIVHPISIPSPPLPSFSFEEKVHWFITGALFIMSILVVYQVYHIFYQHKPNIVVSNRKIQERYPLIKVHGSTNTLSLPWKNETTTLNRIHDMLKQKNKKNGLICMHHIQHNMDNNYRICLFRQQYLMINPEIDFPDQHFSKSFSSTEHSISCKSIRKRQRFQHVVVSWTDVNNYHLSLTINDNKEDAKAFQMMHEEFIGNLHC